MATNNEDGVYNFLKHKRGDDFEGHSFEVMNEDGTPINLAGSNIKIQLRRNVNLTVILEWKTADGSITIIGASNNKINMGTKTGAQMDIDGFSYLYDLQVIFPSGITKTYVKGVFPIEEDISR